LTPGRSKGCLHLQDLTLSKQDGIVDLQLK
jgi:hypothetical protein